MLRGGLQMRKGRLKRSPSSSSLVYVSHVIPLYCFRASPEMPANVESYGRVAKLTVHDQFKSNRIFGGI